MTARTLLQSPQPGERRCLTSACARPRTARCYRNEASGTRPSERWQSYMAFTWTPLPEAAGALCDGYWPTRALIAETETSR